MQVAGSSGPLMQPTFIAQLFPLHAIRIHLLACSCKYAHTWRRFWHPLASNGVFLPGLIFRERCFQSGNVYTSDATVDYDILAGGKLQIRTHARTHAHGALLTMEQIKKRLARRLYLIPLPPIPIFSFLFCSHLTSMQYVPIDWRQT